MATARLIPSTYSLSNTSLTVSNANNMYANTDSTNYASIGTTSTNTRYIYVKGFNFGSLPSGANVTSFTIKYKGNESGLTTSTSYRPRICNNTTTLTGSSSVINTTANTYSFTGVTNSWSDISGYGSNFSVRFTVRASQNGSQGYLNLYGVEIEVQYELPRTITSSLVGNGTIDPNGAVSLYHGEDYTIEITPTNSSDTVTVTNNDVDVSSQLVPPGTQSLTDDTVLGTYALVSGGFNGSGATYFQGLVGNGYDATPYTGNYYSSGNGTIAVFTYQTPISVPSNATITDCYVMVNGHAESTSQSSEYMCVQLYAGSTAISDELNFKSIGTSNSTQTIHATTLPTASQCANLHVQCRLGYYGGAISGATVFVTYTATVNFYTYTFTVSSDATIVVTISGGSTLPQLWWKKPNSWETFSTKTNSNSSSNISSTSLLTLSTGQKIRIQGTLSCWYNGITRVSNVSFDETWVISSQGIASTLYMDSSNGTLTMNLSMSTVSFGYVWRVNTGTITGTYTVYTEGTDGGWVKVKPYNKGVMNRWYEIEVDPTSLDWGLYFGTSFNYRNMDE